MVTLPLVGLTEIAQAAGVQKPVVAMWRTRDIGFPTPAADLHGGAAWWWPEVKSCWSGPTGVPTPAGRLNRSTRAGGTTRRSGSRRHEH